MKAIMAFIIGAVIGYRITRRSPRRWVDPGDDTEWARYDDGQLDEVTK